jgi:hypothetical protein
MTRLLRSALCAVPLAVPLAACQPPPYAAVNGPMCAQDEVVGLVTRDLGARQPYSVLLPGSIGEVPSRDPAVVRCVATIVHRDYDFERYWTQAWQGSEEYTVRKLRNGYEVKIADATAR